MASVAIPSSHAVPKFDPKAKTAAVLVNGFNGLGLHTLFGVIRNFGRDFKNFIFIQVGVIDAGNFKGVEEVAHLQAAVERDLERYVSYMKKNGFHAESYSAMGTDVIAEIEDLALQINKRYPGVVFFGGQLVFPQDTIMSRWLHNYSVFSLQRRFYQNGIPIVILPIRV